MGIAFAAPPGIVTAETLRRGVARGFPAALAVQLGSLVGDAAYCLLALAGVAVLVQNPITQRALGLISVVFLLYLAITGIYAELRTTHFDSTNRLSDEPTIRPEGRNSFFTGVFLSLTNPWAIGFWLSLGGTLASYGAMESGNAMALFFGSFFGACLAYAFLMAFLIGITRQAIPPRAAKWISLACSVVIGMLGIGVALQVIQLFISNQ